MASSSFRSIRPDDRGLLTRMLHFAYAPLLKDQLWMAESQSWDRFDGEAFDWPETVGRCVFVTEFGGEPVGFMSYDPTKAPQSARIGHNCILPAFQGQGLGTLQVREALRRLNIVRSVLVSTGEQPFFEPARRMYSSCGFTEVGRHPGGLDPQYRMVEYEYPTGHTASRLWLTDDGV